MKFDIIIPSRPNLQNLQRLLASIKNQPKQPQNIYIVIDKVLNEQEYLYYQNILTGVTLLTNIYSDFVPNSGVSYVRNFGIKNSKSEYMLLLDDDTSLPTNFIQNLINSYTSISEKQQKPFILFPTIKFQNTNQIQTQGYSKIHYLMMRPEPVYANDRKSKIWKKIFGNYTNISDNKINIYDHQDIFCCPSICLFGEADIFRQNLYDERMKFVYEDIDMTARISNKGIDVYNLTQVYINHYETARNKLQASFLNSEQAYNKSKNRMLFVQNNAKSLGKILFYGMGVWIQTLWFIIFVIIFGERKVFTIGEIISGTKDGFFGK